jgi:sulfhydrogenase subunit alpha
VSKGTTVAVNVDYVSRVEGHGNIIVTADNGELVDVKFEVTEPPRFFEGMLRGRPYDQAPLVTSRICGICSNGHVLASLTAMENALEVTPSDQTTLLRRLLMHGETIQSHVLHAYFLVAPDFLDVGSVIPLAATHPDVVKRALRMKKLGNDICDVVGGRSVHQIAAVVGGFTHLPTREELLGLRRRLDDAGADLQATVELFASLTMPEYERPTEYLSLKSGATYAYFGDLILSSNGDITPVRHYREKVKERIVEHSSAKHCDSNEGSFMVGALARFNNGHSNLSDGAKAAAGAMGLSAPCTNTFMNTVAQVVETAHCVEDSIAIIDQLVEVGIEQERPDVTPREGRGVGAVEVPRGTLYHEYGVDRRGLITDVNLIIPTGQNLNNLEQDMRALAPTVLPQGGAQAQKAMEMLVRAYDPCISCSTHVIELDARGKEVRR